MAAGVISREYAHLLPGQMVPSQGGEVVPQPRPAELLDPWEVPQWQNRPSTELSALSRQMAELATTEESRTLARTAGDYRGALFVNGDINFHVHKHPKRLQAAALPAVTRQQKDILQLAMIGLVFVACLAAIVQSFRPILVQFGGGYERVR